ncbi:hypothetical protein D3C72_769950 [compost metagenome]
MAGWLTTAGVLVATAVAAPAAVPTRLGDPMEVLGGGAIAFEAQGPVRYHTSVLKAPDRWVVDFVGARYHGGPVRWQAGPGSPVRALRVANRADGGVRAVFELSEPLAVTPRVEHVGGDRYRFVVAWAPVQPVAPPQPVASAPRAAGPVVFDVAIADGQVRLMTSAPMLGRIVPLSSGAGYRVEFDGAVLDAAAPRTLTRSQGDIRQVRLSADASGVRLIVDTPRPGRRFTLAVAPTAWAFSPVLDSPSAAPDPDPSPTVVTVSGRPSRPAAPGVRKRPQEPWAIEVPGLAQGLVDRLRVAPAAPEGFRWRQPALDAAWRWRSTSQMIYTSNVGLVTPEAAGWGALHRYQGSFHQGVPALRGYLMGHAEHQRLRFAEPRYDFDSMLHAMAMTHHLGGLVHAFEGGAMMYRRGAYSLANDMIDTDLFAGLGLFGNLGPLTQWSTTLTADRVTAASLSGSYYGQALRTRWSGPMPLGAWLQADAMVQRLDPVIIGAPSYRWYGDVAIEKALAARWRVALQARWGGQLGVAPAWYVQGGPSLSLWF